MLATLPSHGRGLLRNTATAGQAAAATPAIACMNVKQRRARHLCARAASESSSNPGTQTTTTTTTVTIAHQSPNANGQPHGSSVSTFDINERMEFLKRDLVHLFDDQGIDRSAYDSVVEFKDPITRYSSLQGYLFNIQMLKRVFSPKFELHDIRQLSDYSVVSRWTMTMAFTPAQLLPLVSNVWQPQLIFTGTSTYCFNPANGKINRHIDTWDSISNQAFFSLEAFADFWRQMLATYTVPQGLETPNYTVLRRTSDYQIREYPPFLVAEAPLDAAQGSGSSTLFNPASAGNRAFGLLAGYIFGGNERKEKMEMTTPVFTDTAGSMQFVIGPSAHKDVSTVPRAAPGAPVKARVDPGGVFAVRLFPGIAGEADTDKEAKALLASLDRDGVMYEKGGGWRLARYNDPGTLPPFRRNEVLVPLAQPYELWRAGELEQVAAVAGVVTVGAGADE